MLSSISTVKSLSTIARVFPEDILNPSTTAFFFPLEVCFKSDILKCSEKSSKVLAEHASVIANAEGLFSHKESASFRKSKVISDE